MIELFDKKFVHFMWDDELEGKQVFVADNINSLIERIEKGTSIYKVRWSRDTGMPFESEDLVRYRFAYYDENYEVKKAFNEGKKVQYQLVSGVDWADIDSEEALECRIAEGRTFRIKPEEKMWIAYLARPKNGNCYLSACTDTHWESAQKEFGAKTKLFIGTHDEVSGWYESRQKFAEAIKAWEDGKRLQFRPRDPHLSWQECGNPSWDVDLEYRVKPECPCEDGIDSKACVGCEHSEDGKKEYRPYINSAEMIMDFIDRFKVKCPSYCEPLIWVRLKVDKRKRLIVAYGDNFVEIGNKTKAVTLQHLFEQYEFLDGSPVGMEE